MNKYLGIIAYSKYNKMEQKKKQTIKIMTILFKRKIVHR